MWTVVERVESCTLLTSMPNTGEESLADKYEYVMHGKVYRCEEQPDNKLAVFISFGGLLMRLKGDTRSLQQIELDSMLYILIRKS